jgi:hypothetical protein
MARPEPIFVPRDPLCNAETESLPVLAHHLSGLRTSQELAPTVGSRMAAHMFRPGVSICDCRVVGTGPL